MLLVENANVFVCFGGETAKKGLDGQGKEEWSAAAWGLLCFAGFR